MAFPVAVFSLLLCAVMTNLTSEMDDPVMGQIVGISWFIVAFQVFFATLIWRNSKRTLIIDETSIRMTRGEKTLWELTWERYGGFRTVWPVTNRGAMTPYKAEFLDIEGKPVGQAKLIELSRLTDRYKIFGVTELLASRIPAGGHLPKVQSANPTAVVRVYWALCILGVFMFVFGFFMSSTSSAHAVFIRARDHSFLNPYQIIMMIGGMLAGLFGGQASIYPRRLAKPPAAGNLEGFAVARSADFPPVALEIGKKYCYVDVPALRDNLNGTYRHTLVIMSSVVPLLAVSAYSLFTLPWHGQFSFMAGLWAPMFAAPGVLSLIVLPILIRRLVSINRLRRSLDDQFEVLADKLEVNHAGTIASFPLQTTEKRGPMMTLFGSRVLQFRTAHERYWLDPRFLQEV
jgi:hypothetical protein